MRRFYVLTRYHVWLVIDRETDRLVQSFGARGRGDAAARQAARDLARQLNEQETA